MNDAKYYLAPIVIISLVAISFARNINNKNSIPMSELNYKKDTAYFGEGCFWCTEAFFQRLKGVLSVTSGYGGGNVSNPTYEQVCDHTTGHVELAQIIFDSSVVSFDKLLEVFWETHDPTTYDQQGNDVGPQYKSVIYYIHPYQKETAEKYKMALDKSGSWNKPIVTEILPFKNFYPAEKYHQNFYNGNKNSVPYCKFVIQPKLDKFEAVFKKDLKP